MFNRWLSLLYTVAILIGIGVCFNRYDSLLINEVKSIISVVFGFATSCLLLSFIWIIQKKPLRASWPTPNTGIFDTPSMHPRGSLSSTSSTGDQRGISVCTVSSTLDQPPNYENALINSKPVNWNNLYSEKTDYNNPSDLKSNLPQTNQPDMDLCARHSNESTNINTIASHTIATSRECTICTDELISDSIRNKNIRRNSMAQFALSIVRGFTTIEHANLYQHVGQNQTLQDNNNLRENTQQGKLSYYQLDVNQLIESESPPRYYELSLDGSLNGGLSNHSDEPKAGNSGL